MAAFEVATSADGTTWVGHHECTTTDASVTFGSTSTADEYIKQTYDHLYLLMSTRGDVSAHFMDINLTLNGDTGTNYSGTGLYGDQTPAPLSWRDTGYAFANWGLDSCGASMLADTFGTTKVWIPHYSNTANFKQILASGAAQNNSTTNSEWRVHIGANLWSATPAAVTEITLTPASGNFVEFSTFTLYGLTGA